MFFVLSIAGMMNVAYAALPLVYVDPAESTANPTEFFTIDVNVEDVTDLYSYGIKISFNPQLLQVDSYTEGPFLKAQPGGTFFSVKIEFDYVDVVCASLGAVPGISGSGTLFSITFEVTEAGTCPLDIFGDVLIDHTLTAIEHESADGEFYTSASANLVARSAWPEHHHYVVSKDEDAYQTLSAKVKNLGTIDLYVKVVFEVMRDDGFAVTVSTEPILVVPGAIETVSANLPLTGADAGKYYAAAKAWYSWEGYYYSPGKKNKTFSFAVVP